MTFKICILNVLDEICETKVHYLLWLQLNAGEYSVQGQSNISEVEPSSEASEKLVHFAQNLLINSLTSTATLYSRKVTLVKNDSTAGLHSHLPRAKRQEKKS